MVKLKELSSLVSLCNEARCSEGVKKFNKLRSRALNRSFCDFTYECEQVVEELSQSKRNCSNSLIMELNSIIRN